MTNSKRIFLKVLPVMLLIIVCSTSVFGFGAFNENMNITSGNAGTAGAAVQNAWSVVLLILQVLAVAAFVFAGVRYMFASADQKADIKKSLGALALGAVLVFGASTVINFLVTSTNEIL